MFRSNVFAISALGLCLATAPTIVGAQSVQPAADGQVTFVPLVDGCIAAPTVDTCQEVRAVVADCASDLDHDRCAVLFEDAEQVFDQPLLQESAQTMLSTAAEAIAVMKFTDVENGDIDDVTRANAERTLLRGDENLMSHSAPPLLESDTPPPDSKAGETGLPQPEVK